MRVEQNIVRSRVLAVPSQRKFENQTQPVLIAKRRFGFPHKDLRHLKAVYISAVESIKTLLHALVASKRSSQIIMALLIPIITITASRP